MPALERRARPAPIAEAMSAAIHQALRERVLRKKLLRSGADFHPLAPEGFTALRWEEDARWPRAAREGLILRAP